MQIVWFKRDLRIHDHPCLFMACQNGPVLPLYIMEPDLWAQPDMGARQYHFLCESLTSLKTALKSIGLDLVIRVGDAVDILNDIHQKHKITTLYSHQETWNMWTYKRDLHVKSWTKTQNISWVEPMQNGVVRRLRHRDGWENLWYQFMKQPPLPAPKSAQNIAMESDPLPAVQDLKTNQTPCPHRQQGGGARGLILLKSFLYDRGEGYTKDMSSPLSAFESCSRLSAHMAFGTLSTREIYHAAEKRNNEIHNIPPHARGKWPSAMKSFLGRLRWHCHFIQKLEDEPEIEFQNMHPMYDGLRENDFCMDKFNAWAIGHTGYPMVDACMRALIATGWINFRMRAMLMSFASYHLWLHWRPTSTYLATLFTDYEPGIHYSQAQMQSGTTGINSIRIYNPIKQSIDQDPDGIFIKKWIPELKDIPVEYIHEPWKFSEFCDKDAENRDLFNHRDFHKKSIHGTLNVSLHSTESDGVNDGGSDVRSDGGNDGGNVPLHDGGNDGGNVPLHDGDHNAANDGGSNDRISDGYPGPIVDEKIARKNAADKLYGLRKDRTHKDISKDVVKKHASRKHPGKPKTSKPSSTKSTKPKSATSKTPKQESLFKQGTLPL